MVAADGHTYEKAVAERIIKTHEEAGTPGMPRSPMTNMPMGARLRAQAQPPATTRMRDTRP